METETRARAFAEAAHGQQRYGALPYVAHLAAVRAALEGAGTGEVTETAAWLHDVVEDTAVTVEEVAAEFGPEVAALVWAVTGEGATRAERVEAQLRKVRETPAALALKLADRVANVEASVLTSPAHLALYRKEHAAFRHALRGVGAGPAVEALWERLEAALA